MKLLSVRLQNPLNFSIGQTLKGLALSAVSGSPLPTPQTRTLPCGGARVLCVWRIPLLNLARDQREPYVHITL